MNNESYKLMNNYKIYWNNNFNNTKNNLSELLDYKWTWWLYNDSNFKWSEMKQGYGNLFILKAT